MGKKIAKPKKKFYVVSKDYDFFVGDDNFHNGEIVRYFDICGLLHYATSYLKRSEAQECANRLNDKYKNLKYIVVVDKDFETLVKPNFERPDKFEHIAPCKRYSEYTEEQKEVLPPLELDIDDEDERLKEQQNYFLNCKYSGWVKIEYKNVKNSVSKKSKKNTKSVSKKTTSNKSSTKKSKAKYVIKKKNTYTYLSKKGSLSELSEALTFAKKVDAEKHIKATGKEDVYMVVSIKQTLTAMAKKAEKVQKKLDRTIERYPGHKVHRGILDDD